MAVALLVLAACGCERSARGLSPYPLSTDPVVFADGFGAGIEYKAFLGSKLDAVSLDPNERHAGTASMRMTVPALGDPSGGFAGGAVVCRINRDLSGYDALTFWAKASRVATLNTAGFGNDNTGTSRYEASRSAVPLTTTWTKYVIPIPLPARLASEQGLFFVAEGHEGGLGCDIWFDDVLFEATGSVSNPRPSMRTQVLSTFVGATVNVQDTRTMFNVDMSDVPPADTVVTVAHFPGYMDFQSSDDLVARAVDGAIQVISAGSATVRGKLGGVDATGQVTISATEPPSQPAPTPTLPAGDVISLFSDAYTNVPVDSWLAFGSASLTNLKIAGNDTKGYTNLTFVGVKFQSPTIDATSMTHWHLDAFVPNGTTLKVKLVDFGANGVFDGGGDDREHELLFNPSSVPVLIPGRWSQLDIPFTDFTNLTTRAHLAQMILSGASTVFVDNVYLRR